MLVLVLAAAASSGGGSGVNIVAICATCIGASAAVIVSRSIRSDDEDDQAKANGQADGIMPEDTPLIECYYDGVHATHDGPRYVHVAPGVLYIGSRVHKVDDLVPLDSAVIKASGEVVTVAAKRCPLLTLNLGSEAEAVSWMNKLKDAATPEAAPEASPKSEEASKPSEASAAHQARIEQLEKRVNATLKEAVSRAQRIQELEVQVKEGHEQRQKQIQDLKANAEQCAKDVSTKAKKVADLREQEKEVSEQVKTHEQKVATLEAELAAEGTSKAALKGVLNTVQDMVTSAQEHGVEESDPILLRTSADKVQEALPKTDTAVTELMEGMASALRWPTALKKRLAAAEQSASEHRKLQDASMQQLEDLKKQFDQERIQKEEAETRAADLQKQLAIAQEAANEASEKLLALEDTRAKETMQLKQQIEVAQAAADANTAKLEDALAVKDEVMQKEIAAAEAEKSAAEAAAEDLRGRIDATRRAAANAEAQLHELQASRQDEISELKRQLAIARESMADNPRQLQDDKAANGGSDRQEE
mmetsp:Transcript_76022/g.180907  ORF Transcript_76022/g.180907 Transcript_76022/m.180907 type:complete len:534 (+) Transcript_76022:90-1691(+)